MAFSIGIISYAISTIVSAVENAAEDVLGVEKELAEQKPIVVPASVAKEVFDNVTPKGTKPGLVSSLGSSSGEMEDAHSEPVNGGPENDVFVPAKPESELPGSVQPSSLSDGSASIYAIDVPVDPGAPDKTETRYFLRYSYDADDIPNARMRTNVSRNASRIFARANARRNRAQADERRAAETRKAEAEHGELQKQNQKASELKRRLAAGNGH